MNFLSLFRPRSSPAPSTFNERAAAFWKWYAGVAPRFLATIEAGRCPSLSEETSAKLDVLFPGLAWSFGPGDGGHGHAFTLSGEGNLHRQLLTQQWLARAPQLEGWTFHAARQAGPIKGHVIEMDGLRFDPKEVWVAPTVDATRECIDLAIWHPAWEKISASQRTTIAFLFLDEALGEYGTEWWVGRLTYGKDQLAGSFPIEELSEQVATCVRAQGWKKYPPGQSTVLYRTKPSSGFFPRSDILTQSTAVPPLFIDYMESAGELADPLAGFGADYVYVSIDRAFLPPGEEVRKRGEVEDAIHAALQEAFSGRHIGGGLGRERCYLDFLVFDGARSLEIIRRAIRPFNVPAGTMIEFFAREKRGQRIAL